MLKQKLLCEDSTNTPKFLKNSTAILAGIGESTAISIIDKISLCPNSFLILGIHSENFQLRQNLIDRGFGLVHEKIIKDKNKLYELMLVSPSAKARIDPVGNSQWSAKNPASLELLQKRINYLSLKLSHEKDVKYEDFLKRLKLISQNLT